MNFVARVSGTIFLQNWREIVWLLCDIQIATDVQNVYSHRAYKSGGVLLQ